MSFTSSVFSILLLSDDLNFHPQIKLLCKNASVTTAMEFVQTTNPSAPRAFNAILVEVSPNTPPSELCLPPNLDLRDTLLMSGSRTSLRHAARFLQTLAQEELAAPTPPPLASVALEDYLELKMKDFVCGMQMGSARNLHALLTTALERPLITQTLLATRGNQVQAAKLLGLNRNTLKKKMQTLQILAKVPRPRAIRTG